MGKSKYTLEARVLRVKKRIKLPIPIWERDSDYVFEIKDLIRGKGPFFRKEITKGYWPVYPSQSKARKFYFIKPYRKKMYFGYAPISYFEKIKDN